MTGPTACPDWRRLAAGRRELGDERWDEALDHAADCRLCRGEALAADPALIFRRMPELALEGDALAAEVAALQQGVATLRAASRLQQEPRRFPRLSALPLPTRAGWKSWATAAAMLAGTGAGLWTWYEAPAARVLQAPPAVRPMASPAPPVFPAAQRVEDIDRPNVRVKQYGGKSREDPSVVMIYDQSLNV